MQLKQYKYSNAKGKDEVAEILSRLNNAWDSKKLYSNESDDERTQEVKTVLINLGHEKCKNVYANRLSDCKVDEINKNLSDIGRLKNDSQGFKNTEWLYDVHWYTDSKSEYYMLATFDLACEIEWNKIRQTDQKKQERINKFGEEEYYLSGLKYDFQKLLVSNAKINLFITKLVNEEEVNSFFKYCKTVLNTYTQLSRFSKFLVVCFVKDSLYYFQ